MNGYIIRAEGGKYLSDKGAWVDSMEEAKFYRNKDGVAKAIRCRMMNPAMLQAIPVTMNVYSALDEWPVKGTELVL